MNQRDNDDTDPGKHAPLLSYRRLMHMRVLTCLRRAYGYNID